MIRPSLRRPRTASRLLRSALASPFSTTTGIMAPPAAALDFVDFVNASPTPYHAVKSASERFQRAGFQLIKERDCWTSTLQPGGKYFLTRNGSSIIAFAIGHKWRPGNPVSIVGAHTDSPCLRVKPVSNKSAAGYLQLGVETYGGGIWHSWFDRDLSLAGRVMVREGDEVVQRLVKVDKPLLRIPTLAIHLDRSDVFSPNRETELFPITGLAAAALNENPDTNNKDNKDNKGDADFKPLQDMQVRHHPAVLDVIATHAGVHVSAIVDFELVLYDTQKSCIGGLHDDFIFSPRLDNLGMTYCSVEGLIASVSSPDALDSDATIRMTACFDHEEVGSDSAQGAHSNLLPAVLRRLSALPAVDSSSVLPPVSPTAYEETLARSFLISADMAHAIHPNYAAKHESSHQPAINGGTVIKINASQRYATNSPGIVLLQDCAARAQVPLQLFVVRNDSPCGSTIGPGLATLLGIRTLDLGNPQLSMHSIRETGGTADVDHGVKLFAHFFASYGELEPRILVD